MFLLRDLRSQSLNFGSDLRVVTIFLGQLCLERRLLSLACTQKVALLLCIGSFLLLFRAHGFKLRLLRDALRRPLRMLLFGVP